MNSKQFAAWVLETLKDHPEAWEFKEYNATLGSVKIWIGNRPYGDLRVDGRRIGNWWQRKKIREAMDSARFSKLRTSGESAIASSVRQSLSVSSATFSV